MSGVRATRFVIVPEGTTPGLSVLSTTTLKRARELSASMNVKAAETAWIPNPTMRSPRVSVWRQIIARPDRRFSGPHGEPPTILKQSIVA